MQFTIMSMSTARSLFVFIFAAYRIAIYNNNRAIIIQSSPSHLLLYSLINKRTICMYIYVFLTSNLYHHTDRAKQTHTNCENVILYFFLCGCVNYLNEVPHYPYSAPSPSTTGKINRFSKHIHI